MNGEFLCSMLISVNKALVWFVDAWWLRSDNEVSYSRAAVSGSLVAGSIDSFSAMIVVNNGVYEKIASW